MVLLLHLHEVFKDLVQDREDADEHVRVATRSGLMMPGPGIHACQGDDGERTAYDVAYLAELIQ